VVLVDLAVAIVLGAVCLSDIDLLARQAAVFGDRRRTPRPGERWTASTGSGCGGSGGPRAVVRRHVWGLLALRPGGLPWLTVAGKLLTGWVVIDLDATLITAHSAKAGAAVTFKKGFGFHPVAGWCANTGSAWRCYCARTRPGPTR
jgi:hypothetical protein